MVLLAGANTCRMSLRTFLLKTWGYRVATAATAEEALAVLGVCGGQGCPNEVDLLIVDLPLPGFDEGGAGAGVLVEAKRMHPQLRTLVTSNHAAGYDSCAADVLLWKGIDSPAELLERVRILVARKRGPMPLRGVLDAARENEQKKPAAVPLPQFGSKSKGIKRFDLIAARADLRKKPVRSTAEERHAGVKHA